ncbi:MobH family relaxase (plasmid) [Dyella sp. BiH032]|uniref:MobH family relaxase n=1 Tax=Dyella sp. BiH032 TaxID=3075430 RepID=UPI0028932E50|nr:MobH family relaxase [Dyella sp. BiH032]WNL48517.1 MobH family relaxase [Dyella sp. BiH032]
MLQFLRKILGGGNLAAPPPAAVAAPSGPAPGAAPASGQSAAGGTPSPATNTLAPAVPTSTAPLFNGQPIPTYPDVGLAVPSAPPEVLVESQQSLVDDLHRTSGLSHEEFKRIFLPAVYEYARYVHLLPASETHHHYGQGGLFRHGLECAFFAALKCESAVFALDHPPVVRKQLEPRWRIAAMLGAMIHDMGKPIVDVGALDASGNLSWNPHTSSLYDWLQTHNLPYYNIHWRPGARHKRHEAFTGALVYRIFPQTTLDWLGAHYGQEAIDAMLMALSGGVDPRNPLCAIIKAADSASVERDIKESRKRQASAGMGGSRGLAARVVRTIHDQIESGEWVINNVDSGIYMTTEGVVAVYPSVLANVIGLLKDAGETSLPTDVQKIVTVLLDHGMVRPNVMPDGRQYQNWNLGIHIEDRGKTTIAPVLGVVFTRDEVIPSSIVPPKALLVDVFDPQGKVISNGGVSVGADNASAPVTPSAPAARATPGEAAPGSGDVPSAVASTQTPADGPHATVAGGEASVATAPMGGTDSAAGDPPRDRWGSIIAGGAPVPGAAGTPLPELSTANVPAPEATATAVAANAPSRNRAKQSEPKPAIAAAAPSTDDGDDVPGDHGLPAALAFDSEPEDSDEDVAEPASAQTEEAGQGIEVRDRRVDRDLRDEEVRQAQARAARTDWPPASPELARAWFERTENMGAGIYVLALADRIRDGTLKEGTHVFEEGAHLHIAYPVAVNNLGIPPGDLMKLLEKKGWMVRDPKFANRSTVPLQVGGQTINAIRLSEEVTEAMRLLLPIAVQTSKGLQAGVLPMGPYIPATVAALIKNPRAMEPSDGPHLRLAFDDFMGEHLEQNQILADDIAPKEWRALLKQFAKQHDLVGSIFQLHMQATADENAYLIDSRGTNALSSQSSVPLVKNASWDRDLDMRAAAANVAVKELSA